MSVIVTDTGFTPANDVLDFTAAEDLGTGAAEGLALDLPSDADPSDIIPHLARIAVIRVDFPSFADGRGFTIARRLRMAGFTGTLRASGHVLADQYTMARRSGFDQVEISSEMASRQPAEQWIFRADWRAHDYQSRLRA
ncbi:MAG: DUF934 domain-containing protein [Qingshengfaniella sp.]